MIAITACAAALAAVTVGLLLRSDYEKKHFAGWRCVPLRIFVGSA